MATLTNIPEDMVFAIPMQRKQIMMAFPPLLISSTIRSKLVITITLAAAVNKTNNESFLLYQFIVGSFPICKKTLGQTSSLGPSVEK